MTNGGTHSLYRRGFERLVLDSTYRVFTSFKLMAMVSLFRRVVDSRGSLGPWQGDLNPPARAVSQAFGQDRFEHENQEGILILYASGGLT
jgi:hypothetical protein